MKNLPARQLLLSLALTLLLAACTSPTAAPTASPTQTPAPTSTPTPQPTRGPIAVQPLNGLPTGTDGFPWWNDTVFYEIFVRSFYDSDGDGVGDFNGITEKLDYLNDGDPATTTDLGISGLWLMPIHPSPSYHGYDVTDYYAVNSQYGTLDDFRRLLEEAHRRGIKVTIDLVLNHTSASHPWFVEARTNPESPYRDWYLFSESDPGYAGAWGQDIWHPAGDAYYLGVFWDQMPDLNYNNPEVVAEMNKVAAYWLEFGVDGFRLDAVRYLVEEGTKTADTLSNHTYWEQFRLAYKATNPQAITIGEVWTGNFAVSKYLEGDELDLAFNFELADQVVKQVESGQADTLGLVLDASVKYIPNNQFATFLTNHDQNRLMNQIGQNVEKAKTAASLLLTMPGVPFIYYGEEIGMTGVKPDENIRTPMQWSTEEYAGFSTAFPWRSVNREYRDGVNVTAQQADPSSLWSHYRNLVQLRNEHAALRVGKYTRVKVQGDNLDLFAFVRHSAQETVLVLVNLSFRKPAQDYTLAMERGSLEGAYQMFPLLGLADGSTLPELAANASGGFDELAGMPAIPANAVLVLQLAQK
jgi:glycosidase